MDEAGGKAGTFSEKLTGLGKQAGLAALAVGAAGLAGAVVGLKQGFEFNSQVEQAQTKLMAFMKDGTRVAQTLAWVKDEAAKTQFSFTDMADAAATLTPYSKATGVALKDLVTQAEVLAAINPAEGLSGAAFSLREALSNDWVSIVDRFNLPRTRIMQLKDQGVPAMEIISRTLQEMGIDYGLVADQGKTVSARWDQITDKLKIMAGTATKPIFDRVSQELYVLGNYDYNALGNNLAQSLSGFLAWVDDITPKMQELGRQVGEYLGPKFQDLAKTFVNDIWPVTERMWKEVFAPLAYVLGTALVVAVGLAIDALKLLWVTTSNVASFFLDVGENIAKGVQIAQQGVVVAVDGIKVAWKGLTDFFTGIPGFFSNLWASVVSGVQNAVISIGNWFAQMPGQIAFALGFAAGWLVSFATVDVPNFINTTINWFAQLPGNVGNAVSQMFAAARGWFVSTGQEMGNRSAQAVSDVGNWFQQLPGRVASAAQGLWNGTVAAFNSFKDSLIRWANDVVNGVVGQFTSLPGKITGQVQSALDGAQRNVGGFFNDLGNKLSQGFQAGGARHALGSSYTPGGYAVVGEHGPELVNLPQGAQVTPAYRTRAADTPASATSQIFQVTNNIYNQTDYNKMLSDIGFALRLAS